MATIHADDSHDKQWELINSIRGTISGIGDEVREKKRLLEAKLKKAKGPAAKLKVMEEWDT